MRGYGPRISILDPCFRIREREWDFSFFNLVFFIFFFVLFLFSLVWKVGWIKLLWLNEVGRRLDKLEKR